jgi:protocatechuate 3,4-dioxygenase beta subunit
MHKLTRRGVFFRGASIIGVANLAGVPVALADPSAPASCATPTACWNNVPEYKWGAPERTSLLEPGTEGERLTVTGRVLTTRCEPVPDARLEFWHTDSRGDYDFAGFKLRGLQRTDKDGRYHLETVMPGRYSPIRHIHYLVGAKTHGPSGGILLANAIELPTDEENKRIPEVDARSNRVLISSMARENGMLRASFDIVLNM